jgi:ribonuclease P protein component
MKTNDFRFPGKERIKSKKLISRIFNDGIFHSSDFISVKFILEDCKDCFHQAAFIVSKRNVKLAVNRNRIKRLMKEAYRLNKHLLYEKQIENTCLKMVFIYRLKEVSNYHTIKGHILKLLGKLNNELSKNR